MWGTSSAGRSRTGRREPSKPGSWSGDVPLGHRRGAPPRVRGRPAHHRQDTRRRAPFLRTSWLHRITRGLQTAALTAQRTSTRERRLRPGLVRSDSRVLEEDPSPNKDTRPSRRPVVATRLGARPHVSAPWVTLELARKPSRRRLTFSAAELPVSWSAYDKHDRSDVR